MPKRLVNTAVALGLVASGLIASAGAAEAATPTCEAAVAGVLPDGRLLERFVRNVRLVKEHKTAAPLPFRVDSISFQGVEKVEGGRVLKLGTYTAGARPRNIDVTRLDASTTMTAKVTKVYRRAFAPRIVAGSGNYYVYGIDRTGNLKRWTRYRDSAGNLWFDAPRVVARNMGGLRTLSYYGTPKIDGTWRDVLYGTTRSGALKQFQVPWRKPSAPKITTLRRTGFAAYTGLSLATCNLSGTHLSIIAIDRLHNRARWYTLPSQFSPKGSNLVRRGLVAPGANWRLHATL